MTPGELQQSVVLITSSDQKNATFGTGFVIRQQGGTAYLLTCAHVVKDVGGAEQVRVGERRQKGAVIASGEASDIDLAVLRVEGLFGVPALEMEAAGDRGMAFLTAGFRLYDRAHLIKSLHGKLGDEAGYQPTGGRRLRAWDLQVTGEDGLQPGYSGAPVVDRDTGRVLGVISHRLGSGKSGLALSVEALEDIWKFIDSEQLYRKLLKLGYRQQVRLFRRLVERYSIAALLLHGSPDYGQRWLLNRLLHEHFPYNTNSRVIKIGLTRRTRRSDASALWRELCSYFALPKTSSPLEIAQKVYQALKTQNIILIFHNVEWIPRQSLRELVTDFWLPLAGKVQSLQAPGDSSKLYVFFVDYEGTVGSLEELFAEQPGTGYAPVKAPKLTEFSEDELMDWLEDEGGKLSDALSQNIDDAVQEILDSSEGGIPELTLEEICDRCGCNWYEESEKWLKY